MCIWTRGKKNRKMHFGLYIIYINIYKDKRIFQYQLEKLFSKIRMSLDLVYSFHIRLISRQKANTIHTLIIKYSHNNSPCLVCVISSLSLTHSAFSCHETFLYPEAVITHNGLLFVRKAPCYAKTHFPNVFTEIIIVSSLSPNSLEMRSLLHFPESVC